MPRVDQLWLRLYGLKQLLLGPTQSKYWSLLESTEKQPTLNKTLPESPRAWILYTRVEQMQVNPLDDFWSSSEMQHF